MLNYILLAVSIAVISLGYLWRRRLKTQITRDGDRAQKKSLRRKWLFSLILMVIGGYLFLTRLIPLIFGTPEKSELDVSLWAPRVDFHGLSLSVTVIYTWVIMAILVITALVLRFTLLRRLKTVPRGAQNVLEIMVEQIMKYTNAQVPGIGEFLGSYIFSLALFMVGCAFLELFRLRAPTADLMLTFSMALITFFFINWYGIKKKGGLGRLKALASPTPVVFIFRVISDVAVPVSLASRLFGNMLGGMIVMDLIYSALGTNAVGIPSVLGLYFNVFHPLIQTFIFITLTLTFIHEATE